MSGGDPDGVVGIAGESIRLSDDELARVVFSYCQVCDGC
jgi:hypothetical protein